MPSPPADESAFSRGAAIPSLHFAGFIALPAGFFTETESFTGSYSGEFSGTDDGPENGEIRNSASQIHHPGTASSYFSFV
jgi:hypothetical protein